MSVGEMEAALGILQPTLSQQLAVLKVLYDQYCKGRKKR
jgi:hypothetical protein